MLLALYPRISIHPLQNQKKKKRTTSYYAASKASGSAYVDPDTANRSIHGLKEFDACPNVMFCLVHDPALLEVLPLLNGGFGESVNAWKERGRKEGGCEMEVLE